MQQSRPPHGGDPRFYCPDRDVAWITPGLTEMAIDWLRQSRWEYDFAAWMAASNVTEMDLHETAVRFVHGLQKFREADTLRAHDGLEAAGFFDCPPAARYAILARLGLVYYHLYYNAIREAEPEDMPPDSSGLAALEKTVIDCAPGPRLNWRRRWLTGIRKLLGS